MKRSHFFLFAALLAIFCHDGRAQTMVSSSQVVCPSIPPAAAGTVVVALAIPGPQGTPLAGKPAKVVCAVLDASGFRLDTSTNPPTLRALAVAAPPAAGPVFVDGETPAGAIDGNNAVFNLGAAPVPATSLRLFVNGIRQQVGADFTLAGSTVTFLSASVPQPGYTLAADYRH